MYRHLVGDVAVVHVPFVGTAVFNAAGDVTGIDLRANGDVLTIGTPINKFIIIKISTV